MCGIMGYVGPRSVTDVLLKGLKRLEYRGYDSAGVAYFEGKDITIHKSEGKIRNVETLLEGVDLPKGPSHCGIGHTRWATHGKPTTQNAHPHRVEHVVLVHNGIIENYREIRDEVQKKGKQPQSETDSELFGFLVVEQMESGLGFEEAVRRAFLLVKGACSVVVMSDREPGKIIGIRNGSPLVVAHDPEGGVIFASDAQPILEYTQKVHFLENGDLVVGSEKDGLKFFEYATGRAIERKEHTLDWSADALDKGGYDHYMLKEIFEQPRALVDTLNSVLDRAHADPFPLAAHPGVAILNQAERMVLVACGTSWHAALVAKYWIERWAQVAVDLEYASEYRYRDPVIDRRSVVVGISQSGETADTLAVIQEMRKRGIPTLAVTNVRGSTISREADAAFFTAAGPEIGVAATKTFSAQMIMLMLWAGYRGLTRGKDTAEKITPLFNDLLRVPHALSAAFSDAEFLAHFRSAAKKVQNKKGFFFIGRGYQFPIALEGALKLKEIAYIHAEGYAAGELKHGPIAMIDEEMVVVALAPSDSWYEKTVSNLEEVQARGAVVIGVGDARNEVLKKQCDIFLPIPAMQFEGDTAVQESLMPFLVAPVLQLLSYEIAVLRGTDIDQPRNLAKSVTVE